MEDRNVLHPQRYQMVPVPGTSDIFDFIPAPGEVYTEGTLINKATLWKDATAALFGLGPETVPDDGFAWFGKYNLHWWKRKANEIRYVMQVSGDSPVILCYVDTPGSVQYSDRVDFNELTGEIALVSPVTASVEYAGESDSGIKFLRGKYFKTSGKVYFSSETANYYVDRYTPRSPYGIYAGEVTAIKQEVGEVSYVQSSDRSAYPDSGTKDGYEYEYLGIPFENAVGAPKIETGSYVGTGKYGASNPNSLTFGFSPKFFMVALPDQGLISSSSSSGWIKTIIWFSGISVYQTVYNNTTKENVISAEGNTISWYSKSDQYSQLNENALKYVYVVIG